MDYTLKVSNWNPVLVPALLWPRCGSLRVAESLDPSLGSDLALHRPKLLFPAMNQAAPRVVGRKVMRTTMSWQEQAEHQFCVQHRHKALLH